MKNVNVEKDDCGINSICQISNFRQSNDGKNLFYKQF